MNNKEKTEIFKTILSDTIKEKGFNVSNVEGFDKLSKHQQELVHDALLDTFAVEYNSKYSSTLDINSSGHFNPVYIFDEKRKKILEDLKEQGIHFTVVDDYKHKVFERLSSNDVFNKFRQKYDHSLLATLADTQSNYSNFMDKTNEVAEGIIGKAFGMGGMIGGMTGATILSLGATVAIAPIIYLLETPSYAMGGAEKALSKLEQLRQKENVATPPTPNAPKV